MKIGQYSLDKFGLYKNKKFLELIYNNPELIKPATWFDIILPGNLRRTTEEDMTLEKFLKEFKEPYHLRLQIGSPDEERIRYIANIDFLKTDRFAWLECPFNEHNHSVVERLFGEAFLRELSQEKSLI